MIKYIQKYIPLALILGVLSISTPVNAQLGDAGEILKAGSADANILLKNYLDPFGKGFGASMNTGWFTSASTHKKLGFDLSFNVGVATVPSSGLTFDASNIGLTTLEVINGSSVTPTINGDDNTDTELGIYFTNPVTNQDEILTQFDMPAGIGFEYVPAPMVQASVGLIKSTDVSLRYIPSTDLGDFGSIGLVGFGFKHGLNQWIPGGKLLPINISLQMGYTQLAMDVPFDVNPESGVDVKNDFASTTWDGQGLELTSNAFTTNIIVGKTLPFISGYVGLGYETSSTSIATAGSYPITSVNDTYHPVTDPQTKKIEKIDDPIDFTIEGDNSVRAFAGIQVKLALIKIFANYTVANYSSLNAGFGITFR